MKIICQSLEHYQLWRTFLTAREMGDDVSAHPY